MTDSTGLRKPRPPSARPGPASEPVGGTVRRMRAALGVLFPEAREPRPVPESGPGHADAARSAGRRAVYVAVQVAAVCTGAAVLLPRIAGSWPGYVFTGDPLRLPAGHFGLGHGSGAHAPDEYYVIESTNPAVRGMDGAVRSHVEYLYELARTG